VSMTSSEFEPILSNISMATAWNIPDKVHLLHGCAVRVRQGPPRSTRRSPARSTHWCWCPIKVPIRGPRPATRLPLAGVAPPYLTLRPPSPQLFKWSSRSLRRSSDLCHAYWVQSVQQDSGSRSVHPFCLFYVLYL